MKTIGVWIHDNNGGHKIQTSCLYAGNEWAVVWLDTDNAYSVTHMDIGKAIAFYDDSQDAVKFCQWIDENAGSIQDEKTFREHPKQKDIIAKRRSYPTFTSI